MHNFTNNCQNFATRPSPYCVWVPLHDDGRAPLVSIWIDPTMTAFECQQGHEDTGLYGVSDCAIADEIEDPKRRIARLAIGVDEAAETVP
ncbi:MAG: hypothetical protein ABSA57_16285 [Candidatus Acidiferrales bacterium]|jgi:hypothetical protein